MKRFIASELWQKEWWQKLSPKLKSFYYYMISTCDAAGVWEPNFSLATFLIGESITEKDMVLFNGNIEKIGKRWWLKDFIEFQYGKLSKDCKAHNPVFASIRKHNLSIGYTKAIYSLQDKDKDKDKDKDPQEEDARGNPKDKDESYGLILKSDTVLAKLKYEDWLNLKRSYPKANHKAVVVDRIAAAANSQMQDKINPYAYLKKALSDDDLLNSPHQVKAEKSGAIDCNER